MNLKEQIGVLISATEVRRDQWKEVATGTPPGEVVGELWEAWQPASDHLKGYESPEAQQMADILTTAIEYVHAIEIEGYEVFGFIGDDMPTCPACGSRPEIVKMIDDFTQVLHCQNCDNGFIGEWEEESDDE